MDSGQVVADKADHLAVLLKEEVANHSVIK